MLLFNKSPPPAKICTMCHHPADGVKLSRKTV